MLLALSQIQTHTDRKLVRGLEPYGFQGSVSLVAHGGRREELKRCTGAPCRYGFVAMWAYRQAPCL